MPFFYKEGDAEDPKVFSDHSYCLPQPPGALGSTSAPEKVPKGKKARDDGRTAASSPLRNKENTPAVSGEYGEIRFRCAGYCNCIAMTTMGLSWNH